MQVSEDVVVVVVVVWRLGAEMTFSQRQKRGRWRELWLIPLQQVQV